MKSKKKKFIAILASLFLTIFIGFSYAINNPYATIKMMNVGVDIGSGYIKYTPDFYVVVIVTERDSNFNGVKYVVILRDNYNTKIDLLKDAGVENVETLSGEKALQYLEEVSIDLSELDERWLSEYQR